LPVQIILVILAGAVGVAALSLRDGSGGPASSTADRTSAYVDDYGGLAEVYDQILGETDCATLQEGLDTAAGNADRDEARGRMDLRTIDVGYMLASEERLREMGCDG